jgi:hypothetical protein
VVIIETSVFTKHLLSLLTDEEYRQLQARLVEKPDAGKLFAAVGV